MSGQGCWRGVVLVSADLTADVVADFFRILESGTRANSVDDVYAGIACVVAGMDGVAVRRALILFAAKFVAGDSPGLVGEELRDWVVSFQELHVLSMVALSDDE